MKVAVVKPDWGITGGFELLIDELVRRLEAEGNEVTRVGPKVSELSAQPFGLTTTLAAAAAPEFFRHVQLVEAFRDLDLHRADLVISSQPPSYATYHPRHLSIFSHHLRCYYDLSDVLVEAGLVEDLAAHRQAERLIRHIDNRYLLPLPRILATSEEVKGRLRTFNGLDESVGVFHAGPGFTGELPQPGGGDVFEHVLCVSRHEFPKRTELFVHAMRFLPELEGISIGVGGRLGYAMELDRKLRDGGIDPDTDSRPLWCTRTGFVEPGPLPSRPGAVTFRGYASTQDLDGLYRRSLCVVAPAYLEDYGLTAIEAMAYGKPLIVCEDGGNLVNFVEDGVNGFVVAPQGGAIAYAVRRLAGDRGMAAKMGEAARETASAYTWSRAMRELADGVERVLST